MADDRNSWQDAVIDELVSCGIYSESHDTNPSKAVQDLIAWNNQVALDPAVSEEAKALQEQGFEEIGFVRSQGLGEVQFNKKAPESGTRIYKQNGVERQESPPPDPE